MKMASAFIAAIPLALVLVVAVVVAVAVTPGSFGFQNWPASPVTPARDHAVVTNAPVDLRAAAPRAAGHQRHPAKAKAIAPARAAKPAAPAASAQRLVAERRHTRDTKRNSSGGGLTKDHPPVTAAPQQ